MLELEHGVFRNEIIGFQSATTCTIEYRNHSVLESLEQETGLSKPKWFWAKISLEGISLCPSNYFIFHHLFRLNQLI